MMDKSATTHLERYAVGKQPGSHHWPNGFSGHGYAVVDSASGEILGREAFRVMALELQARIEAAR